MSEVMEPTTLASDTTTEATAMFFLPDLLLRIVEGPLKGRAFAVHGEGAVLGRAGTVVLDSPGVSRRHAQLSYRQGCFVVTDLGSNNGTFVNGRRTRGDVTLKPGDLIQIAEHRCRVELGSEGDGPTSSDDFEVHVEPPEPASTRNLATLMMPLTVLLPSPAAPPSTLKNKLDHVRQSVRRIANYEVPTIHVQAGALALALLVAAPTAAALWQRGGGQVHAARSMSASAVHAALNLFSPSSMSSSPRADHAASTSPPALKVAAPMEFVVEADLERSHHHRHHHHEGATAAPSHPSVVLAHPSVASPHTVRPAAAPSESVEVLRGLQRESFEDYLRARHALHDALNVQPTDAARVEMLRAELDQAAARLRALNGAVALSQP